MEKAKLKAVFAAIFSAIFILGITLRAINMPNVARRSPDEGIYSAQGKIISESGYLRGTRLLLKEYNSDNVLWIYPPPTRIGYSWLLATLMKALHRTDAAVGSYISFASSVVSLVLIAVIGLRFFNPWITSFALLFMAVSPMELAIARRSWQDAIFGCLGLAMVYFCLEITRNAGRHIWYALLILLGSYIVLIKEPGAAVFGICALWIFWVLAIREKDPVKGVYFIAACAAAGLLSFSVLAYVTGGFGQLLQIFGHIKDAMPTNTYAIEYQSGPLYRFLEGFWIISPVSSVLFLIGAGGTLLPFGISERPDAIKDAGTRQAVTGLILFGITFFAIALFTPYCQNLRYVSVAYGPFYLAAGLGLWYIVLLARPFVKKIALIAAALAVAVLILAALRDYQMFNKIFIRTGIMDVSIRMVREYSR